MSKAEEKLWKDANNSLWRTANATEAILAKLSPVTGTDQKIRPIAVVTAVQPRST